MHSTAERSLHHPSRAPQVARRAANRGSASFADRRPQALAQAELHSLADASPQVASLQALQMKADQSLAVPEAVQFAALPEEEELLQGKFAPVQRAQEEEDLLQGKFERIAGSSEAALRKVDPTTRVNGVAVNDDASLEHEADVMGEKAAQFVPADEEEMLQAKLGEGVARINTGLPDSLKTGIENLSGMSMGGVKVHYNSSKPAALNALAYAQGRDIHLGPGQERHLPHEAWHVVQQNRGQVRPTTQMKASGLNDAAGLEGAMGYMEARLPAADTDQSGLPAVANMPTVNVVQKMAWAITRPLGVKPSVRPMTQEESGRLQGVAPNASDRELKSTLHTWHEHISFDSVQASLSGNDNVGFHCASGSIKGPGELFAEDVGAQHYSVHQQLSASDEQDELLLKAIGKNNPPGAYDLATHNCQNWVKAVKSDFQDISENPEKEPMLLPDIAVVRH